MRRVGAILLKVLGAARTAWDVLGVTLLLVVVVLGVFVVGRAARARLAGPPGEGSDHPYAGTDWRPGWVAENATSLHMRWEPFVYWQRRPFRGRWINVDSLGFRITPQPVSAAAARRRVWFFGGSTMWGTGQRDSMTIPAVVARELASRGVAGVHVRNFGETGYVSTQELLRLLLELRAGARPDVVVFYDGINDAAAAAMDGRCGIPQNESRRQMEFAIGRFLTLKGSYEFGDMVRAMRSQLSREGGVAPLAAAVETPALRELGLGVVDCYARNVRLIESLAGSYGFRALYVWQPTPSASNKPLTPFERHAVDSAATDGLRPYLWVINRVTGRAVDSALAPLAPGRVVNLSAFFRGDTSAVWLDFVGHLTEAANGRVAKAIASPIETLLR